MSPDFSIEEFDQLIKELSNDKLPDRMLYIIADKVLRKRIRFWCYTSTYLNIDNDADDIFNITFIRLMQNCVTNFFRNNRVPQGEINYDPGGFQSWMITVAQNVKNDYERKIRCVSLHETPIDINTNEKHDDSPKKNKNKIETIPSKNNEYIELEHREIIARAFDIVLNSNRKIYMILSWLALNLFILDLNMSKINSTHEVLETFKKKTLFEMWILIRNASKKIDWIEFSSFQCERIEKMLKKETPEGIITGDMLFESFFGKNGGETSISDWSYRINQMIKDMIADETPNN